MKLSDLNSDLHILEAHAKVGDTWHSFGLAWPVDLPADLVCGVIWQWKVDGVMGDKACATLMDSVLKKANPGTSIKWFE